MGMHPLNLILYMELRFEIRGMPVSKSDQNKRTAKSGIQKYWVAKAGGSFKAVDTTFRTPGITKLVVGKRNAKVVQKSRVGTVIEQRVHGADGRLKTVYTVDSGSETFGTDLGYAFKKNVAQARRENKKRFGAADAAIRKE